MLKRCWSLAAVCLLCGAWWDDDDGGRGKRCEWNQWGQSAAHDGQVCVDGQRGLRMLARLTVDPFADQETAEHGGSLLVHYPAPLLDDDGGVFVMEKGGSYVSCDPPGSGQPVPCGPASRNQQVWMQRAYEWRHGELRPRWTFASDWKPIPTAWEATFQAAMGERSLFIPGAGGTVFEVDKRSGATLRRINPFGDVIDPLTWVTSGLTLDRKGNLFYNVIRIENPGPAADAHSWLVRVSRHGDIRMVDYRTLIPDAPSATDLCYANFNFMVPPPPRPWPPPPQPDGSPTLPPQLPCGSQRAGVNVTPAIGKDGTIFTVTRAHRGNASDYGYVVALRPDLSLKWATSLRGHLDDGCGVLTPYGTGFFDCREGATEGVDLATNMPPAGQVSDIGSSSPVALPDGGVLYGAFTGYNGFRGHLFKLDRRGRFKASFDFGWDVTPAVVDHHRGYSIVVKNNFYFSNGPFLVTQLDEDLDVEWHFANTSTLTCERQPDDTIECEDTGQHPNGFEWCINAPAVDRSGTVYGLNEDGYMYAIDRHGREVERVFLTRTLSAAYTPLSIDVRGRIYAQNNGEIYILGR
jgi:outer membrane protein assembly factor BamB